EKPAWHRTAGRLKGRQSASQHTRTVSGQHLCWPSISRLSCILPGKLGCCDANLWLKILSSIFGGTLPRGVENHRFMQQVFAPSERVGTPVVLLDAGFYFLASSAAGHRGRPRYFRHIRSVW